MKVALCTSDFFSPVQDVIREQGHEVTHVFTSCELNSGFSAQTKKFAEEMRAKFRVGPVSQDDVKSMESEGVEVLLAGAYDFKIPTPEDSDVKFINIHGSMLPEGRGPWPQPWTLLRHPEHAGVTFHSMTQEWDLGDVVLQAPIKLTDSDSLNTLVAKTLVIVKDLSSTLFREFNTIWNARRPMVGDGSYWDKPTEEDRTIRIENASVCEANAIFRAFEDFTLVKDERANESCLVSSLVAWEEKHSHTAGEVIAVSRPRVIYSLRDGYVCVVFKEKSNWSV